MKTLDERFIEQAEKVGESFGHLQIALRRLPRLLEGFDQNTTDGKLAAEALLHLRRAEAILAPNCEGEVTIS